MPGLAILPLLTAAAPGLFQAGLGLYQGNQANKIRLQDTRPDAFKEELALNRQRANSAIIPGQQAANAQIQQNIANSASALAQSGVGSSGVLAGLSRLNQNANQATVGLNTQAAAYQDQAKDKLVSSLRQDSAFRQQDLNNYNREKAALAQAGKTNLFGALSGLGSVGMMANGGMFDIDQSPNDWKGLLGANTINQYGTGGQYDPNQTMPLGVGMWDALRQTTPGYFDMFRR